MIRFEREPPCEVRREQRPPESSGTGEGGRERKASLAELARESRAAHLPAMGEDVQNCSHEYQPFGR
jgi:hypothetical protein